MTVSVLREGWGREGRARLLPSLNPRKVHGNRHPRLGRSLALPPFPHDSRRTEKDSRLTGASGCNNTGSCCAALRNNLPNVQQFVRSFAKWVTRNCFLFRALRLLD